MTPNFEIDTNTYIFLKVVIEWGDFFFSEATLLIFGSECLWTVDYARYRSFQWYKIASIMKSFTSENILTVEP